MPKHPNEPLLTVAEATDYKRTSRHADVQAFIRDLQRRTDRMNVVSMGKSAEGQEIPVLILSRGRHFTPRNAHASGQPIVMVIANIHAGEVEGKEALLMLAREITTGKLARFMEKAVLVLVPDYNPDGNDRINTRNRALDLKAMDGQVGPEGGVGTRYNGQELNLNRDYMKMEAVETRLLSKLYGHWRPHVFVDCHTTDGSIHGYDLTFDTAHTLESGPKEPILYARDKMLPAIAESLRKRSGHRTFFYANFKDQEDPTQGWETYAPLPRYGSHYRGLTGRIDVLLEAYSYIDFRARCDVMYSTLVELFDYVAGHGKEIRRIVDAAERETVERGRNPQPDDAVGVHYGVAVRDEHGKLVYRYPAYPLYDFQCEAWDLPSQRERRIPGRKRRQYKTTFYGRFVPMLAVRRPRAYVIPAAFHAIADHLRLHNIEVERLTRPLTFDVEQHEVIGRDATSSPDVGTRQRTETVFWTRSERAVYHAKPGDFRVDMAQPLAAVAIYLLEPESDDGYVRWGFFDGLKPGQAYPVRRVLPDATARGRMA